MFGEDAAEQFVCWDWQEHVCRQKDDDIERVCLVFINLACFCFSPMDIFRLSFFIACGMWSF